MKTKTVQISVPTYERVELFRKAYNLKTFDEAIEHMVNIFCTWNRITLDSWHVSKPLKRKK